MATDDGGAAFPCPMEAMSDRVGDSNWTIQSTIGMSLRDYLAAQALIGIIASLANPACSVALDPKRDARDAYRMADAMLAARKAGV